MITVRGVLVSSSSSSLHLPSSLSLSLHSLPSRFALPLHHRIHAERVHDLESNRSSQLSPVVSSSRLSYKCSGTPQRCTRRLVSRRSNVGQFYRERVSGREEGRGRIRSIFLVEEYPPFLLIFSRSNSNKWNYAGGGIFERLSRIRKFPSRERPRVDKALFARLISSPDGFQ